MTARLDAVASWLRDAESIVVLTGAGISTDSGIPDFRGPDGMWTKNPDAEKLATIDHYLANRDVRIKSWQWRRDHPAFNAEPNSGHRALADLEKRAALDLLVTQNVDGLHNLAGSSPERVVEIHGNMREAMCVGCDWTGPIQAVLARVSDGDPDPACQECGSIVKTATVFFGEGLDPKNVERAERAAAACDIFLAVGTSLQVYPVALLPHRAVTSGARLVIINAEETPMDPSADAVFGDPISEVLPPLVEMI